MSTLQSELPAMSRYGHGHPAEGEALPQDDVMRECELFGAYLGECAITPYILGKYLAGQRYLPAYRSGSVSSLDLRLLKVARGSRHGLRAADMYARFFRPGSLLRQKLVLLLAILENSPTSHRRLDTAAEGNPMGIALRVAGEVVASLAGLAIGTLRFGPAHLLGRMRSRTSGSPEVVR